jgi:hypothetical protein
LLIGATSLPQSHAGAAEYAARTYRLLVSVVPASEVDKSSAPVEEVRPASAQMFADGERVSQVLSREGLARIS